MSNGISGRHERRENETVAALAADGWKAEVVHRQDGSLPGFLTHETLLGVGTNDGTNDPAFNVTVVTAADREDCNYDGYTVDSDGDVAETVRFTSLADVVAELNELLKPDATSFGEREAADEAAAYVANGNSY